MPRRRRTEEQPSGWRVEVYNPDYQLTEASPLWAATHWHAAAGPPAISIHAGLEVGVVLTGREEVQLDGCTIPGVAGDVWLCAMSEPHTYRVAVPGTMNLVLVFLPSFLGEEMLGETPWLALFAARAADRPRVAMPETRQMILAIAQELRREVEQKREGWECATRLELLRLLFHLSRGWRNPSSAKARSVSHPRNLGRIMPALALLHERTPRLVSREEAARACGLGRSRFTMLFHETMGVSFKTFRKRARIAFAANMLVASELPLGIVAERAGFSDTSHLSHSFVQEYNCTPGQYRRQGRA
ncbi:MAG: helix-turn-helix domain-containing protein [Armatimonadota bacterium]